MKDEFVWDLLLYDFYKAWLEKNNLKESIKKIETTCIFPFLYVYFFCTVCYNSIMKCIEIIFYIFAFVVSFATGYLWQDRKERRKEKNYEKSDYHYRSCVGSDCRRIVFDREDQR